MPCRSSLRLAAVAAVLLLPGVGRVAAQSLATWYLAEGNTAFFEEEILIGNPGTQTAAVEITYLRPGGLTPIVQTFSLAPTRRTTVKVNTVNGLSATDVSARVRTTNGVDIVVERSMYQTGSNGRFGHNSTGVAGAALTWYLAEGATGGFDDFVLIANPDTSNKAAVKVTFARDTGPLVSATYELLPGERRTIWVNIDFPQLASASFSTLVESTTSANVPVAVPVFVERAMYFPSKLNTNPPVWKGAHGTAAVTAASTSWKFAEGYTGNSSPTNAFDTFVLLGNPSASQSSDVTVTFLTDTQQKYAKVYTVPAGRRVTVWANLFTCDPGSGAVPVTGQCNAAPGTLPLADAAFSISLSSTVPIVAERAVYWGPGQPSQWKEAHDATGVTADALAWAFAEGAEGGFDTTPTTYGAITTYTQYTTFYLLSNPNASVLNLRVTFFREDGTGLVRTLSVPAQSRATIWSAAYPELSNQRFAAAIESTNNTKFVAERAMYWGPDFAGGHASPGTPWVDPGGAIKPIGTPATPPNPTLTQVSPSTGLTIGGTSITLTGTEFTQGSTVTIGGAPATGVRVVTSTMITAVTPAGAAGPATVQVTSRGLAAALTNGFTYTQPPLAITAISPAQGPTTGGNIVDITGAGFVSGVSVSFGGTAALNPTILSLTTLRVTAPPHATGTVDVSVTWSGITVSLSNAYTYQRATATDVMLAYGDSITYGVTTYYDPNAGRVIDVNGDGGYPIRLQAMMRNLYPAQSPVVRNGGYPGECIAAAGCTGIAGDARFPGTLQAADDVVILHEGYNDINAGLAISAIINAYGHVINDAITRGRAVLLPSLIPNTNPNNDARQRTLNSEIQLHFGNMQNVVYVDLYTGFPGNGLSADGLHPNSVGYDYMAAQIFNAIVANYETVLPIVP